jgi:hypothetical protein
MKTHLIIPISLIEELKIELLLIGARLDSSEKQVITELVQSLKQSGQEVEEVDIIEVGKQCYDAKQGDTPFTYLKQQKIKLFK